MSDTPSYVSVGQVQDALAQAEAIVGDGPVILLNLLRFRDVADYSQTPDLAPDAPISGAAAYDHYISLCDDRLKARGDKVLLMGPAGPFLIGPPDERWDRVLVIWRPSLASAAGAGGMADPDYQTRIAPHRTAALEDSRLLPVAAGAAESWTAAPPGRT